MSFPFYNADTHEMVWDVGMGRGSTYFLLIGSYAEAVGVDSPLTDFEKYGEGYLAPEQMRTFMRAILDAVRSDPVFWELCQVNLRTLFVLSERLGALPELRDDWEESLFVDDEETELLKTTMRWEP